jgi:hypothetical protein
LLDFFDLTLSTPLFTFLDSSQWTVVVVARPLSQKKGTIKNRIIFSVLLWAALSINVYAQFGEKDSIYRRHFIGSTLFIIATPVLTPSPEYFLMHP